MTDELVIRSVILDELQETDIGDGLQEALVKRANSAYGLLSSIPMICKSNCSYRSVCPIAINNVIKEGSRCPIESDLIKSMFLSYCNELQINPDYDKVQAGLIKDLCSVEIQAFRANKLMSFEDFLVDAIDAINPANGEIYYRKDLHIAVTWSERLLNQKIRILETLAATPLIKVKYMGGDGKDTLQGRLAELKKMVEDRMPKDLTQQSSYEIANWSEDNVSDR